VSASGSSDPSRELQDRGNWPVSSTPTLSATVALQRLQTLRPDHAAIEAHGGRIVQTGGDALLICPNDAIPVG
jgi:hypothetical protein